MSTQKRLLIIGLLNAPPSESPFSTAPLAHLKETVQAEIRKTKEAGYEVDVSLCDDRHFDNALLEIKTKLQAGNYDGVSIGNGVRGTPGFTVFFENLVNLCRETQPGARLIFNSHPGDLYEAIARNFGR